MLAALVRGLPQSNVARMANRSPLLVSRRPGMGAMWLCFNDKAQLRPEIHPQMFLLPHHFNLFVQFILLITVLNFALRGKEACNFFRYRDAIQLKR